MTLLFTDSSKLLNYSIRFLLNFRIYSSLRYRVRLLFKKLLRPRSRSAPLICVSVCASTPLILLPYSYSVHSLEIVLGILWFLWSHNLSVFYLQTPSSMGLPPPYPNLGLMASVSISSLNALLLQVLSLSSVRQSLQPHKLGPMILIISGFSFSVLQMNWKIVGKYWRFECQIGGHIFYFQLKKALNATTFSPLK